VATDVTAVIGLRSNHGGARLLNLHDPAEPVEPILPHVECVDCHNPHAVQPGFPRLLTREGPIVVPGSMVDVPGVTIVGVPVDTPLFYYQVCLRCHGDRPVPIRGSIVRNVDRPNIRRQISPISASRHPIATPSRSSEVPSLLPGFRGQRISCQDCHNYDGAVGILSTANGPHGSNNAFLLADEYSTRDFTIESPQAYALCYRCHDRNSVLNDESFSFHRRHVVDRSSPCSACHAPHGVPGSALEHSHLINFDRSIVRSVVAPGGGLRFRDLGRFQGSCTLLCHGVTHLNFRYGPP
jgi:hypothetical protein